MTIRHLGRFKMTDSRITTTDVLYPPSGARTTTTRTRDVAEKMELARFPGHHVIAEREGDDLVVYQIGDPDGLGVTLSTTGDRTPRNLVDLQKTYDEAFGSRRKTHEQQVDRHTAGQVLADLARR
jgi:hypothetical protein